MPKFEVRFKASYEGCLALARATLGRRIRTRTCASLLVTVMAAAFMVMVKYSSMAMVIMALSLAFAWYFLRSPRIMARKMLAALPDPEMETILRFYDDRIDSQNSVESGHIAYGDIMRIWVSQTHFAFYLANDGAFSFAKAEVTKGGADRFARFISEKTGRRLEPVIKWTP